MKRLALFAASALFCGCAAQASAVWVAPPPPPPPSATVSVDAPAASADAEVDVAPAPEAAPEELVATSEPPELIYEEQDDGPGPGMVWVGGYWQWTGSDWAWYYGGWRAAPEGRIYVEPYYEHVDDHVVYVGGYWGERGAEPRYYGGDRIVFAVAVRPEGYVRGRHTFVARSGGLPPGRRGKYGPRLAGAKKRPLPTATAPRRAIARHEGGASGEGHAEQGHVEEGHTEQGHTEPEHAQAEKAAKPESGARPEAKPAARAQAKPASKPRKK